MRLSGPSDPPAPEGQPTTVPDALRVAATRHGHRPAITVLRAGRRDEQGFASLLKWTAKGAHLLEIDHEAGPGDAMLVDAPPGWPTAVACLAAWWLGLCVHVAPLRGARLPDADPLVEVADGSREAADDRGHVRYVVGDAIDGTPLCDGGAPDVTDEPWTTTAQLLPDDPPASRAAPDLDAVITDERTLSQIGLLEAARAWGEEGTLGVSTTSPPEVWVPTLVRPLVTRAPTVIVGDDVSEDAIERERIAAWAGHEPGMSAV